MYSYHGDPFSNASPDYVTVDVWNGTTGLRVNQFSATNKDNDFWKVFTINGSTVEITPVDTYVNTKPTYITY